MNTGLILVLVLLIFGVIVAGVIIFKKYVLNKHEKKPDDKEVVQQELNRMLEEVKDEDTKAAMANFDKQSHQDDGNKTQKDRQ